MLRLTGYLRGMLLLREALVSPEFSSGPESKTSNPLVTPLHLSGRLSGIRFKVKCLHAINWARPWRGKGKPSPIQPTTREDLLAERLHLSWHLGVPRGQTGAQRGETQPRGHIPWPSLGSGRETLCQGVPQHIVVPLSRQPTAACIAARIQTRILACKPLACSRGKELSVA